VTIAANDFQATLNSFSLALRQIPDEACKMKAAVRTQTLPEPAQRIVPAKFSHFVLKTARFTESVAWWKSVLEARVVQQAPHVCFMTYDEENHRIAIVNAPHVKARDTNAAGVDHLSYTYRSLGELLGVYIRLKSIKILPRWTINHRITTSFYYQDPDGNRVELQVENFRSDEELNRFFASDTYAKNTLGVRIDPEKLIVDYQAGLTVDALATAEVAPFGSEALQILTEMGLAAQAS
jgi:catechol-2,3-dioxygenase